MYPVHPYTPNGRDRPVTTNWQRPRDEHGRFAKPADIYGDDVHAFVLGPQMGLCRECGRKWAEWPHIQQWTGQESLAWPAGAKPGLYRFHAVGPDRPLSPGSKISPAGWIEPVEERTRLLAALPFVIALLGLGFSIAALIVGVQR